MSPTTRQRLAAAGLDPDAVQRLVDAALIEDLAGGVDVTSVATVSPALAGRAAFIPRRGGVLAGMDVAAAVL